MGVFGNMDLDKKEYDYEDKKYHDEMANREEWINYILDNSQGYSYLSLWSMSYDSLKGLYAQIRKQNKNENEETEGKGRSH